MALLKVFLIGVLTLCTFTILIYNFFLPKINYEMLVNKNHDDSKILRSEKLIYKQINEQIDKLNYDQIDIVKDELESKNQKKLINNDLKKDLNNGSNDDLNEDDLIKHQSNEKNKKTIDVSDIFELGYVNNKEEEKLREDGFKNYAFNLLISNRLGYKRDIPDTRNEQCNSMIYTDLINLPKVSIIICFYNEAKSTLFRSVQSILDRTEDQLIEEIILVNDLSDSKLK